MGRRSQKLSLILLGLLFLGLVGLSFWHTSLSFGDFRPGSAAVGFVLWGILTLVGLGVFALGFILLRSLLKLYIERRQGRLGSKIKTKLVAGALILSVVPVVSMVIFSFTLLSRTFDKWLFYQTRDILTNSEAVTEELNRIMLEKIETDAAWIATMPEAALAFEPAADTDAIESRIQGAAQRLRLDYVGLIAADENDPGLEIRDGQLIQGPVGWLLPEIEAPDGIGSGIGNDQVWAVAPIRTAGRTLGRVVVAWSVPQEIRDRRAVMENRYQEYLALEAERGQIKYSYLALLSLITVFVLFVAVWLALYLSRQISIPIEALAEATSEVSSGHLDYRVETRGFDELGGLVAKFNHMTQALEEQTDRLQKSNRELEQANAEIESRRVFINAILESVTPGVISINAAGEILKANSSVRKIFPSGKEPGRLRDLFEGDDLEEVRYMLKRAQRIGLTTREFEIQQGGRTLHLAVTVSALERQTSDGVGGPSRFVVVIEDTTELLRAQKSAAWTEVARRVAHEIKNPLTPIALSAERMARLLDRLNEPLQEAERRDLLKRFERSTGLIMQEVESLRRLVDEFSQLARFPKAQPERADLNTIVREALEVFDGRLEGVTLRTRLDPDLPAAMIDPEQFKRVVINLVDNAAEALRGQFVREILVSTRPGTLETVELVVADSGPGISQADREKLFLPYFSTKSRGTGLGLAIVSRVVSDHGGAIRVEDNRPTGSRFVIEAPVAEAAAVQPLKVRA